MYVVLTGISKNTRFLGNCAVVEEGDGKIGATFSVTEGGCHRRHRNHKLHAIGRAVPVVHCARGCETRFSVWKRQLDWNFGLLDVVNRPALVARHIAWQCHRQLRN